MLKGDIVLTPLPFTDYTSNKLRPALILAATNTDLTLAFITTQLHWQEPTNIVLLPLANNEIKKSSIVRLSKLATVDQNLTIGKIGKINTN